MAAGQPAPPQRQGRSARQPDRRLRTGGPLFPGVVGYADTVVPQVVNALLSKHNFILLGLRGQAKTRMLRALVGLLDEYIPVVAGCELRDDPFTPLCAACRAKLAAAGDDLPIAWLPRERYVEKLATPDVTIADLIGDIDPIKAARRGRELGDEQTMHYGLLPRANRGMFAINELPDLAGKIQVGLFNILQEGDVQIKGYPVRLRAGRADGLHRQPRGLHGARQDHHAAQGPHRFGDPHALRRHARARHGDHGAGGLARSRRRTATSRCRPGCGKSSRRSRFRRAPTAASTSAPA